MNFACASRLSGTRAAVRFGVAALLLMLLGACAAPLQSTQWRAAPPADLSPSVELDTVPFFPQARHQCGPAALATVLVWSGADVTPQDIVPQVYLPQRQGSLQLELLTAARRHGRIAYVLAPQFEALLREVAAGHPVIVLQNLGLSWAPRWHYAVVVGFDLAREHIVLRSGGEPRHILPFATFERTWRRGSQWALVVLPPAELPATADELGYLRAAASLEVAGDVAAAARAYAAAVRRWPASLVAWFGLGNSAYAQGQPAAAVRAYHHVLSLAPAHGPTLNNLAHILAQQGELDEAERYARAALTADAENETYADTLREILGRRGVP